VLLTLIVNIDIHIEYTLLYLIFGIPSVKP